MSFNMVTSLMPLASGTAPQTYRWALGLGLLIPVVAGALGLPRVRVRRRGARRARDLRRLHVRRQRVGGPADRRSCSARSAPRPRSASGFTFLWHAGLLGDDLSPVDFDGQGGAGIRWTSLLVLVLLVPIVGEVLKQVGPILLASRPAFDDMIDGLTFGVAAGAAFAAAETIVVNRGAVLQLRPGRLARRRLLGLADPVRRDGQADRLRRRHRHRGRELLRARAAGTTASSPATSAASARRWSPTSCSRAGCSSPPASRAPPARSSAWCGARSSRPRSWSRLRYLLHFAVLEAALEASAAGAALKDTAHGTAYCPSCEMPLLGRRQLLRRLRHLGPRRQQGHPRSQPHRRHRPGDGRAGQADPRADARRAWRRRTTS